MNLPTNWTRSYQRVEGTSIVVDVRDGLPSLAVYRNHVDTGAPTQLESGLEVDVVKRTRATLGELMPTQCITVRLDTRVRLGAADTADCVSRALRAHLAGVNVEVMTPAH